MNLFLDDSKLPKDVLNNMLLRIGNDANIYCNLEWEIVKDFREFVKFVENNGIPKVVSFAHDLVDEHYEIMCACGSSEDFPDTFNEKTGLDCAKWLVGHHILKGGAFPKILVHSMNPYGSERIKNYISKYTKQFVNL